MGEVNTYKGYDLLSYEGDGSGQHTVLRDPVGSQYSVSICCDSPTSHHGADPTSE